MALITTKCFNCPKVFDYDDSRGKPLLAACPTCAAAINKKLLAKENNREIPEHTRGAAPVAQLKGNPIVIGPN